MSGGKQKLVECHLKDDYWDASLNGKCSLTGTRCIGRLDCVKCDHDRFFEDPVFNRDTWKVDLDKVTEDYKKLQNHMVATDNLIIALMNELFQQIDEKYKLEEVVARLTAELDFIKAGGIYAEHD